MGVSLPNAKILNVNTSQTLQSALNTAIAGDEIVLANGLYSGTFTINGNNGTSLQPIRIRAANKHQAVLVGNAVCTSTQEGLTVQRAYWIIRDLKFRDYWRAMGIYANNVEIAHNVIDHFGEGGIRVDGYYASGSRIVSANIHDNVIANGEPCAGSDSPGITLIRNVDNSALVNNIIMATGDNGYTAGGKAGYGVMIANDSDNNLVQGNLLLGNSGKAVFRILSGETTSASANENIVRDNAFLFGEGAISTDDCTDDATQFLNNILYGNYFWNWYTKGNVDGTKGYHTVQHNLFYVNEFSRAGGGFITGGEPYCSNSAGYSYKIANILKDNVFYGNTAQSDFHLLLWMDGQSSSPSSIAQADHNLFWASGDPSTWTHGYTFHATDIHSIAKQPIFADASHGDFSLAAGSPGKGAASDGGDIGIQYNTYLKKTWLSNAFTLPTQQKDNVTTSASFTVDPNHAYQIWFYIPITPYEGLETFTIEGRTQQRDINLLTNGNIWVQPTGPARWITLGRATAADGTLNISWSNPEARARSSFVGCRLSMRHMRGLYKAIPRWHPPLI